MLTLKDYVNWGLTHCQNNQAITKNLFDKNNLIVQYSYFADNVQSTETGVAFSTTDKYVSSTYAQCWLVVGNASEFSGKTLTFSTPSYGGTVATKIAVVKDRTSIQSGSNSVKYGDVYYSQITIEDKEWTTEKVCILLYAYGKQANEAVEYKEIMINEGSEVLPYEPYKKR